MGKKSGASRRGPVLGPNPGRVSAAQERLRSGAYGSHQQPEDRPRSDRERAAIEEQYFDLEDDNDA